MAAPLRSRALAALAIACGLLAACNFITGLADDYSRKAPDDAGGGDETSVADTGGGGPDAASDASGDAWDGNCWTNKTLVTNTKGDFLASVVPNSAHAPNASYRASYDASVPGLVYDNHTRLTWFIEGDAGAPIGVWSAIQSYCTSKGAGARIPTRMELVTIQEDWPTPEAGAGADPVFFPDTQGAPAFYWTTTEAADNPVIHWWVGFGVLGFGAEPSGNTNPGGGAAWVRCVTGPAPPTTALPAERFEVSDACGIVRDNRTRLEWERGKGAQGTFVSAQAHCDALTAKLGSPQNPWRVPTHHELSSAVDTSKKNPAIDQAAFGDAELAEYWTSTNPGGATKYRIIVDFRDGIAREVEPDTNPSTFIRCVRDVN